MPHARVLFDSHGYRDGDTTRYASKGEVIEVSDEELKRGEALGSLEKVSAAEAKKAAKAGEPSEDDPKAVDGEHPDELKTPALDPAGDGKVDQSEKKK